MLCKTDSRLVMFTIFFYMNLGRMYISFVLES